MATVAACESPIVEGGTITGTVAYRERIVLPPDAEVEVSLVDISKADAPAATIAETTVTVDGRIPVPYELAFDPDTLDRSRSYALQARITLDDDLLFITATHHPYVVGGNSNTDLMLERVGG